MRDADALLALLLMGKQCNDFRSPTATFNRAELVEILEKFLEFLGCKPTELEHMTQIVPGDVTRWLDQLLAHGGRIRSP